MKTYTMYSGLWRTDGSFVSTIRVKNILVVAPMDITPVLFMADGTPYPLPSVHLAVSGVATINVNDALASAPSSIANHLSEFGSAALLHTYSSPGHVSASMAVIDASRSLSYTFPFAESMGASMRQTLEGLWWKHDRDVSGWIALSNVSDAATQATVQFVGPGNTEQPGRTIAVAPHTTQMFHLEDFASNPSPLAKDAGGIHVQYTGQPGSVLVTGGLENAAEGYSANIPFWGHDMSSSPATSITYAFAGLIVGTPDPMMMPGFPKDTAFSPYLVLRNTSEKPLDVALQLNYMMGMGGSSTAMNASAPVTRNLPAQHLAPLEAKQVDMQAALNSAFRCHSEHSEGSAFSCFNGSINLSASFTGKGGDLLLASGSVDQAGTYVFEVGAQSTATTQSKFAQYWSVANGSDTMFTLFNPSNAAQDFVATFHYGDGSGKYVLPVHLEAQASTMIDMAMLIMEKKPDADGNIIPSNIQEGSADFESAKGHRENITLVVDGGIYNVTTATCGCCYVTCCGIIQDELVPNPMYCPIGQTMQCSAQGVDCNGNTVGLGPGSWSSSNTSIMTVDSSGNVTGHAVGSATISYTGPYTVGATGTFCLPEPTCPGGDPILQDTGNVFSGVLTPQDNFSGRSTTRFGIAEVINLSYSAQVSATEIGGLQWSIVSGGGSLSNAGTDGTATYTAPGNSATVVLRLAVVSGTSQGEKEDYTITVVTPSGGLLSKSSNVRHTQGYISVGFQGHIFIAPTDVSFVNVEFAEGSASGVGSGYFAFLNGYQHPPTDPPASVGFCDSVLGCEVLNTIDQVDTGDGPPPFSNGDFLWPIPWQYQAPGGALTTFMTANHHQTADATGTATISKAGAGPFSKNASDPTTSY
jgi:hypothetical protein